MRARAFLLLHCVSIRVYGMQRVVRYMRLGHGILLHCMLCYGVVLSGVVQHDMAWHGMAWNGMVLLLWLVCINLA